MGNYDTLISTPVPNQPISTSQYGIPVRNAILDLDNRATLLEALAGGAVGYHSSTPVQPIVAAAASGEAVIMTGSFSFKLGYAYQIGWKWRGQINVGNGTGTVFNMYSRVRRATISGTYLDDTGGTATVGANLTRMQGSVIVKNTVADTTQTLVLIAGYFSTGLGTTSTMDLEAATTARTEFWCAPIGLAANFSGALEIPTA